MSVKKSERINFCQIVKVKTKALSMNIKCEDSNCQLGTDELIKAIIHLLIWITQYQ